MARIAIAGGGISGLSLAHFIISKEPGAEVVVFESEKRLGGKIWTEYKDGFLCEGGVNGFLDNRPKTLDLSHEISVSPLRSNDSARKRYVFSEGRLHRLPESPPAFFMSNLLSSYGKIRVACEYFIPPGAREEESLAHFARRRLGKEAYEKLIDPMASGIYAGDPERLSLRACFPKIYDLETRYGSLIKGMIKLQKEKNRKRKEDQRVGNNSVQSEVEKVSAGPGGVLTSFYNGMIEIIDALRIYLGNRIIAGKKVVSVVKKGKGYALIFPDNSTFDADVVILAIPAYSASPVLMDIDKRLSKIVSEISYPSLSVICTGYKKDRITHSLDGFGFLIPAREKRRILGTLWDSSIFPNRAPEGYVLLRSMIGGARASELALNSDSKLLEYVKGELADIMGIKANPDFVRIFKHEMAIPQYNIGHLARLKEIDEMLKRHHGLYLTGNAYRGIGFNDCIENSFKIAEKVIEETI